MAEMATFGAEMSATASCHEGIKVFLQLEEHSMEGRDLITGTQLIESGRAQLLVSFRKLRNNLKGKPAEHKGCRHN